MNKQFHGSFTWSTHKSIIIVTISLMIVLFIIMKLAFEDAWVLALLMISAAIVSLAQQTLP